MRKTRLVTAFILITALLAGSLAGCGKKPATETPEATEESTETGTDTEQGSADSGMPAPEDGSNYTFFDDENHTYRLDPCRRS